MSGFVSNVLVCVCPCGNRLVMGVCFVEWSQCSQFEDSAQLEHSVQFVQLVYRHGE